MKDELREFIKVPEKNKKAFRDDIAKSLHDLNTPIKELCILGALVLVIFKVSQKNNKYQEPDPIKECMVLHNMTELYTTLFGVEAVTHNLDILQKINETAQKHGIDLGTNAVLHGLMIEITNEFANQN